jgi:hypothetical protein
MARPKTQSKARPRARYLQPDENTQRIGPGGKSTGLQVPEHKARKIVAAYVGGMPYRQIAKCLNSSHHTIRAIIANRKDLVGQAEAVAQGDGSSGLLRERSAKPRIVCPPLGRKEFVGPIGHSFLADIFGYLRPADFSAQHAGVYFLFREDRCVYVGQSGCVAARCGQHLFGGSDAPKAFDRALYLPVAEHILTQVEAAAIIALQPEYNRTRFRQFARNNETQDQIQTEAQAA